MKRILYIVAILVLLLSVFSSCNYKRKITAKNISVSPLFSDYMVVERNKPLKIEGRAVPGGIVSVRINNYQQYTATGEDGRWYTEFPPIDSRSSFSILIEGVEETIKISDVVTGKVFVLFGDGNLKANVVRDSLEGFELQKERIPNARVFDPGCSIVKGVIQMDNPHWKVSEFEWLNEQHVYASMLAKKLTQLYDMPVGVVNVICPGSGISSWLPDSISREYTQWSDSTWIDYQDQLEYRNSLIDTSFVGLDKNVTGVRFNDEFWRTIGFPMHVMKRPYMQNRIVWLRKKIFISTKYMTSDFNINLGNFYGDAKIYFNDSLVSEIDGAAPDHQISIPLSQIRTWTNVLSVRLATSDSIAGFYGPDFIVTNADSSYRMDISSDWKYKTNVEPILPELKTAESVPGKALELLGSVLGTVPVSGYIWYGGASNINYSTIYLSDLDEFISQKGFLPDSSTKFLIVSHPKLNIFDSIHYYDQYLKARYLQTSLTGKNKIALVNISDLTFEEKRNKEYYEQLAHKTMQMIEEPEWSANRLQIESISVDDNEMHLQLKKDISQLGFSGDSILGFEVAGFDSAFVLVRAQLTDSLISLHVTKIDSPLYVRYSWQNGNLVNYNTYSVLPFFSRINGK